MVTHPPILVLTMSDTDEPVHNKNKVHRKEKRMHPPAFQDLY